MIFQAYGGKYTPELKSPAVEMPYEGDYTQEVYAQQLIDEYIEMGVDPDDVWPQSFNMEDVIYWVKNTDYGEQAVFLDENYAATPDEYNAFMEKAVSEGINIIAPPMWRLIKVDTDAELNMSSSDYTMAAKAHGLDIITWTLERTGPSASGMDGWYWQNLEDLPAKTEGSRYEILYTLAYDVEILGIFSDWPATVTFFANCMDLLVR